MNGVSYKSFDIIFASQRRWVSSVYFAFVISDVSALQPAFGSYFTVFYEKIKCLSFVVDISFNFKLQTTNTSDIFEYYHNTALILLS